MCLLLLSIRQSVSIEALLALFDEMKPIGRGELLFDDLLRLLHVGRAFVGVMAVGADEMEQIAVHQSQRQPAGSEGRECFGVALEVEGLVKKPLVDIVLLYALVTLDMGEDDAQTGIVLKCDQLVEDLVRPGDKRHFDQDQIGTLYGELRDAVAVGDAGIVKHLGAQQDLGLTVGEQGTELFERVPTALEKAIGRFVIAVKMRGGYDGRNTLLAGFSQHLHGHFGRLAAVVHLRQKMAVDIEHLDPPFRLLHYNRTIGKNQLDFCRRLWYIFCELSVFLYQTQGALLCFGGEYEKTCFLYRGRVYRGDRRACVRCDLYGKGGLWAEHGGSACLCTASVHLGVAGDGMVFFRRRGIYFAAGIGARADGDHEKVSFIVLFLVCYRGGVRLSARLDHVADACGQRG